MNNIIPVTPHQFDTSWHCDTCTCGAKSEPGAVAPQDPPTGTSPSHRRPAAQLADGSRRPGHNRPKPTGDLVVQIVFAVAAVVSVLFYSGGNNMVPMVAMVSVAAIYIPLIGWLAHMEDRAKAHRIWAAIWAISAILAVRSAEHRAQENRRVSGLG